jgi:hypothetical protein
MQRGHVRDAGVGTWWEKQAVTGRTNDSKAHFRELLTEDNALLLSILDGTSKDTGTDFFRALVKELATALNTYGALVADYVSERNQLRPRAYWLGDRWVEPGPYDIAGTPCEAVIRRGELFQIPDRVIDYYPQNSFLRDYDLVSYTGMPFRDASGNIICHLGICFYRFSIDGMARRNAAGQPSRSLWRS